MAGFVGSPDANTGNEREDDSLEAEFQAALKKLDRLDSGELFALSREFRLLHAECLEELAKCLARIDELALFSSNESIEDVSTKELKYMNLNFYIGKVLEKTPIDPSKSSVDARMSVSHLAARKYIEFLSLLRDYGLVETKSMISTLDSMLPHGIRGPFSLTGFLRHRNDRKSKVDSHRQLMKLSQACEEAKNLLIAAGNTDEERFRQFEITRLELHRAKAWDSISGIVDELSVLGHAASDFSVAPLQERETPYVPSPYLGQTVIDFLSSREGATFDAVKKGWEAKREQDNLSTRVENPMDDHVLGPNGKVNQPFVITSGRAETRRKDAYSQVFGTGQKLPTMTIEELVEKELQNRAKPEKPKAEEEMDEDKDEIADALTMKARNWDDFTESVAKGSGNTLNLG